VWGVEKRGKQYVSSWGSFSDYSPPPEKSWPILFGIRGQGNFRKYKSHSSAFCESDAIKAEWGVVGQRLQAIYRGSLSRGRLKILQRKARVGGRCKERYGGEEKSGMYEITLHAERRLGCWNRGLTRKKKEKSKDGREEKK